jgi:hypothetical protein
MTDEVFVFIVTIGGSQWISQGVPLFLILHMGFVYYSGRWNDVAGEWGLERRENSTPEREDRDGIEPIRDWIVPMSFLIILKVTAPWLVYRLLKQLRSLHSVPVASDAFIEFMILPLVCTVVDHSTDVTISLEGNIATVWMKLIQSTVQTYFFMRPLATLAGHDIDPAGGRVSFSVCLLATAVWFSISRVPCESSILEHHHRTQITNGPSLGFLRGMLLVLGYFCMLYYCWTYPEGVQRYSF